MDAATTGEDAMKYIVLLEDTASYCYVASRHNSEDAAIASLRSYQPKSGFVPGVVAHISGAAPKKGERVYKHIALAGAEVLAGRFIQR